MSRDQQERIVIIVLAGIHDPGQQKELQLLLHKAGKEECARPGDPLEYLWGLSGYNYDGQSEKGMIPKAWASSE